MLVFFTLLFFLFFSFLSLSFFLSFLLIMKHFEALTICIELSCGSLRQMNQQFFRYLNEAGPFSTKNSILVPRLSNTARVVIRSELKKEEYLRRRTFSTGLSNRKHRFNLDIDQVLARNRKLLRNWICLQVCDSYAYISSHFNTYLALTTFRIKFPRLRFITIHQTFILNIQHTKTFVKRYVFRCL